MPAFANGWPIGRFHAALGDGLEAILLRLPCARAETTAVTSAAGGVPRVPRYFPLHRRGFARGHAYDPSAATPLGPVPPDVPIRLKKSETYASLMGGAPKPAPGAAGDKVKSGNVLVGGKHFADWFNDDFKPLYPGNHPTLLLWKKPAPMFQSKVNKKNFQTVFDNVEHLWAKELSLQEFLGFFCIFYNETGGTLEPISERGGEKYIFESTAAG